MVKLTPISMMEIITNPSIELIIISLELKLISLVKLKLISSLELKLISSVKLTLISSLN